jgi:hypothetical protein
VLDSGGAMRSDNIALNLVANVRTVERISKYRTLIDSPDCASVLLTRKCLEWVMEVCSPRATVYKLDATTVTG